LVRFRDFVSSWLIRVSLKDLDRRIDIPQRAEDDALVAWPDEIRMAARQPRPRRVAPIAADETVVLRYFRLLTSYF
jgi:hypothetical protein